MTTTAASVANRIVVALQDLDSTRWPIAEVVAAINSAQREIILHRPDANPVTAVGTLALGTLQNLATMTGISSLNPAKLIEITRNMAVTSNKRVVRLIPKSILDDQTQDWHNKTASVNVVNYTYDPRIPLEFYVSPPATTSAQLEIRFCAYPVDIAAASGTTYDTVPGNLGVVDIYSNALIHYALFWLYVKDADYTSNAERAVANYNAFAASMGIELKSKIEMSPNANVTHSTTYPKA